MKISIITITYNAAGVIGPTLRSVREQTFRDFEHIIVDGASSDDTILIARRDGVRGARIISEPDRGIYDAMNKGLHAAKGDFILFLNAGDTFADAGTLQLFADAAERHADIVYADTVIVDAGGNILRPRHLSAPQKLTVDSFSKGMLVCHQAFMVRRSIAPDYNLDYRFSADYDWTIRCMEETVPERCMNLHTVAIHYLADGTTDRNKLSSLKERFNIMREHYGAPTAIARHLSFIPRAVVRKLVSR